MASYLGTLKDEKGNSFYPHSAESQYGRNIQTFTVNGDANTYYPVIFEATQVQEGDYSYRLVHITRGYWETAPDTWNNTTHKNGLTLTLAWSGDSSWGGGDHDVCCFRFHERYSTVVANWRLSTRGLVVWLRGGGAKYHTASDFGYLNIEVQLNGFTDGAGVNFAPTTTVLPPKILNYATLDMVYPVGAIFMSMNNVNPGTWMGGTWSQIAGRFLLGAGQDTRSNAIAEFGSTTNNQGYIFSAGATGGEYHNKLEFENYAYRVYSTDISTVLGADISMLWQPTGSYYGLASIYTSNRNIPHNNMPPFYAVYIWKRTS